MDVLLDAGSLLAAFSWDPQLRGFLIFLTSLVILPGSVYLLLGTNLGARVGFMVALAGLFGWMTVMGIVWSVFGIGLKGEAPHWVPLEVVTGQLKEQSTVDALDDFPTQAAAFADPGRGEWRELHPGDKVLADAQAAADAVLAASASSGGGHGEASGPEIDRKRLPSPFKKATDYVPVGGFEKGGDNELFTIGRHKFFFRHSPHFAIVQVKPAEEQPEGSTAAAEADESEPTTSVVMIRNLGNLRQKSAILALVSGLIFAVVCWSLHERDKEIIRARSGKD